MLFGLIDAKSKRAALVEHQDPQAACKAVGLEPGKVDYGAITRWLHIIVYEFGLFDPPDRQHYFSINGDLYAGNAVLFTCDDHGETVSLSTLPPITWYRDVDAVEMAISHNEVRRPRIAVNNLESWTWNRTP